MSDLGHQRALLRKALRETKADISYLIHHLEETEKTRQRIFARISSTMEETSTLTESEFRS